MKFSDIQSVYGIGIGGIGMSALAQLLQADGLSVSGSDRAETKGVEQLRQVGIAVSVGESAEHVRDVDLVIYSGAVPEDNVERLRAAELGIPQLSYVEALGQYMQQFETAIAVSGTHGKSTTTAMLANMLVEGGLDPTVVVGSVVKEFGSNARVGGKKVIVVEGCEHQANMLKLHPNMIVLTNIEADHLDYYSGLDQIVETFQEYVNKLPGGGVLISNADDANSRKLDTPHDHKVYSAGSASIRVGDGKQFFTTADGVQFELHVPGEFNVANALAAVTAARELGVEDSAIQKTLAEFTGVWRRFEVLGKYRKARVVSDYAHHPTEIAVTIQAAQEFYPNKRVLAVFEPHQKRRTKELLNEFGAAFAEADGVIVQEIYSVPGREEDIEVSSRDVVAEIEKHGLFPVYSPDTGTTREALEDMVDHDDLVLIMGAGNIYQLAESLVEQEIRKSGSQPRK